jgi:hypothetical protein
MRIYVDDQRVDKAVKTASSQYAQDRLPRMTAAAKQRLGLEHASRAKRAWWGVQTFAMPFVLMFEAGVVIAAISALIAAA